MHLDWISDMDPIQMSRFIPHNVSSLAVYPTVTSTLRGVRMTDCGGRCLTSLGCTMFSVDFGNCVLTELTNGTAANVTRYNGWYFRE